MRSQNCGFVFGLSTGHQEIKHGNTAVPLQLTTGRLNLVATICRTHSSMCSATWSSLKCSCVVLCLATAHERCPDDHMQLIGSDCNNSPCFLDFKAGVSEKSLLFFRDVLCAC